LMQEAVERVVSYSVRRPNFRASKRPSRIAP
jgi:hypothetical protein